MRKSRPGGLVLLLSAVLLPGATAFAQSNEESAFHRAYYLEHSEHDHAAAQELYARVAASRGAPEALRAQARESAASLQEELVAGDLARLMPADALFYAELERPGEKLANLFGQLGLLAAGRPGEHLGVSPLLFEHLLGLRGVAVAVTRFDPQRGEPSGVLVLNPGDVEVARGLIDTLIPAGGQSVESIGGHPTWSIEGEAFVTLTHRLVVAARTRAEVEGVVQRLANGGEGSLARNEVFTQALSQRDGLFSFCLNAKPMLPMAKALLGEQAKHQPEMQMALGLIDIDSLRTLSGHVDVDGDGLDFELALQLDQGHRNLVFNLLRMPHVDPATLALVPSGAAFFYAASLNPSGGAPPLMTDGMGRPIVTFLDFGRELFGNLADVAVYGLPGSSSGAGIPDVAAILRVNEPQRSRELWRFALGLASQATGGPVEPEHAQIAGLTVDEFEVEGMPIYLAVDGTRLIVSPSEAAIAQSLEAGAGHGSIADDPTFTSTLAHLDQGATWMGMANVGRCIALALPFAPAAERQQMQAFEHMFADTVIAFGAEHSDTRYALRARMVGVPDVGPMVQHLIDARRQEASRYSGAAVVGTPARRTAPAVAVAPQEPAERFEALARHAPDEARALGEELVAASDDARWLNNFAWMLLTEERFEERFDDLALAASGRSNELTEHGNWYYLDTLALAVARHGELDKAIEIQGMAVELAEAEGEGEAARESLERYRAARARLDAGAPH